MNQTETREHPDIRAQMRVYQGSVQPRNFPPIPDDWTSEWETFPSADEKLKLFSVLHHQNNWSGKRTLVVIHGMGEHGGRYLHFPHYFKSVADSVYCFDLRGHGRSEGLRGHIDRFDMFADDVAFAIRRLNQYLLEKFNRSEIHVVGHSLGGHIALRTLFNYSDLPIHSVTISAPLLGIKVKIPFAKKMAALALSRVWGSLHMNSEINPKYLSHDPNVVEAYLSDRLVHSKGTPLFYTELLSAITDTMRRTSGINTPLFMQVPMEDHIVDSEATLRFFEALEHEQKALVKYPGLYHEIYNEVGKEKILEEVAKWIKTHSKT